MKTILITSICFILIIASCKKKDDEPYIRSESIEIGNYTNMIYHTYDTIIYPLVDPATIDLDLDNDHVADVRLISKIWGPMGFGYPSRTDIYCLTQNTSLLGCITPDTTFFSYDFYAHIGNDGTVNIDQYYIYSCHKINDSDNIVKIEPGSFKIIAKNQQEYINRQDIFKSDSVTLSAESFSFPPHIIFTQDTVFYKYEVHINNCNAFPSDKVKYIGIKIANGNDIKYGWIKILITNENQINLFETAIQK